MSFFSLLNELANNKPRERIGKSRANGVIVSTVYTGDMGWETAISDINGTYPVERYKNKEEALVGHEKWKVFVSNNVNITQLGYGDLVDETEIVLERNYDYPKDSN